MSSNEKSMKQANKGDSPAKPSSLPYVFQSKNNSYLDDFLKKLFYYYNRNELDLTLERRDRVFDDNTLDDRSLNLGDNMKNNNNHVFVNLSIFECLDNFLESEQDLKKVNLEDKIKTNNLNSKKFHLASFLGTKEVEELCSMRKFIDEKLRNKDDKMDSDMFLFLNEMIEFVSLMIDNKNKMEEDDNASINQSVSSNPDSESEKSIEIVSESTDRENKLEKVETVINLKDIYKFERKVTTQSNGSNNSPRNNDSDDEGKNQLICMKDKKFKSHSTNRVTFKSNKNLNFHKNCISNDNFLDKNKEKLMSNIMPDKIKVNPYARNNKLLNPGLVSKHFINEDVNSPDAYNYIADLKENHEKILKENFSDLKTNVVVPKEISMRSSLFRESDANLNEITPPNININNNFNNYNNFNQNNNNDVPLNREDFLRRFTELSYGNETSYLSDAHFANIEVDLSNIEEVLKKLQVKDIDTSNKNFINTLNKPCFEDSSPERKLDASAIRKNRNASFKYKTNLDLGLLLNDSKVNSSIRGDKSSSNSPFKNKKDPEFKYKTNLDLGLLLLNDSKVSTSLLRDREFEKESDQDPEGEMYKMVNGYKSIQIKNETFKNSDCNKNYNTIEVKSSRDKLLKTFKNIKGYNEEENSSNDCPRFGNNNYKNNNKNSNTAFSINNNVISPIVIDNNNLNYVSVKSFNNNEKELVIKSADNFFIHNYKKKIELQITKIPLDFVVKFDKRKEENKSLSFKMTRFSEEIGSSFDKKNLVVKTQQSNFELLQTKYLNTEPSENIYYNTEDNILPEKTSDAQIFSKKVSLGSFSKTRTQRRHVNNMRHSSPKIPSDFNLYPQEESKFNYLRYDNILKSCNINKVNREEELLCKETLKSDDGWMETMKNMSPVGLRSGARLDFDRNKRNRLSMNIQINKNHFTNDNNINENSSTRDNRNAVQRRENSEKFLKGRLKNSLVMPCNNLFRVADVFRMKK